MNWAGIFRGFVRGVGLRLFRQGLESGIDRLAGGGDPPRTNQELTPAERAQARAARQTVKRARKAAQITRRMMR